MSDDRSTTQDLVKIAEDGREGYAKGAEELRGSDRPELATTFTAFSQQRATFSTELQALAATYGDSVKETGSPAAALHRGWMAVRDAITGSGPDSVLKTAMQGEDHAIEAYEKALKADISEGTRSLAQRHLAQIQTAREELQRMLETTTS
ncbi:MAG: hypothetical protein NVSMB55_22240 [Mycobacteriales bacterium]